MSRGSAAVLFHRSEHDKAINSAHGGGIGVWVFRFTDKLILDLERLIHTEWVEESGLFDPSH